MQYCGSRDISFSSVEELQYQRYLTTNSYVFYEVYNSYDLTHTILYDLSRPQWRVGLRARLGVGHSYKFVRIVQLVKYVQFSRNRMNLYEWGRTDSYELATS